MWSGSKCRRRSSGFEDEYDGTEVNGHHVADLLVDAKIFFRLVKKDECWG